MTPYRVVAEIDPLLHNNGQIDHEATYARSKAIANDLAAWIRDTDETVVLGKEFDWDVLGEVLEVPTNQLINPDDNDSDTKTVSVIELYQGSYYARALGVDPIVNGELMDIGEIHSTALPFSIAVSYEEDGITRIITSDCLSYFKIFWTDVITGEQIEDQTFEEAVSTMFLDMKNDLSNITWNALEALHYHYTQFMDKNVGPSWDTAGDVISDITKLENQSPYVHFTYYKSDGTDFTAEEVNSLAAGIVEAMGTFGNHEAELEEQLSDGSAWRSSRPAPIVMPGDNNVIEASSPLYEKMALSDDRLDHANALPYEISLVAINGGSELLVSYLDPNFMLAMMYEFSEEEFAMIEELQIGDTILGDLEAMVSYGLETNSIGLSEPAQVYYDMIRIDE